MITFKDLITGETVDLNSNEIDIMEHNPDYITIINSDGIIFHTKIIEFQ